MARDGQPEGVFPKLVLGSMVGRVAPPRAVGAGENGGFLWLSVVAERRALPSSPQSYAKIALISSPATSVSR